MNLRMPAELDPAHPITIWILMAFPFALSFIFVGSWSQDWGLRIFQLPPWPGVLQQYSKRVEAFAHRTEQPWDPGLLSAPDMSYSSLPNLACNSCYAPTHWQWDTIILIGIHCNSHSGLWSLLLRDGWMEGFSRWGHPWQISFRGGGGYRHPSRIHPTHVPTFWIVP